MARKWPSLTNDQIQEFISIKVATLVWSSIPKMFGSIKTVMIELFDDCYTSPTETAIELAIVDITVAKGRGGCSFQYWDLKNKNPP